MIELRFKNHHHQQLAQQKVIQESLLKSNHRFQIPVLTNIFLTVKVALFVNSSNVAVVHMGFFYKERKRERQNIFFFFYARVNAGA